MDKSSGVVVTTETNPIPPPAPVASPKRRTGRKPVINTDEKWEQGMLELAVDEPFGSIDINDVLSDL
jgi:hypothetical protein